MLSPRLLILMALVVAGAWSVRHWRAAVKGALVLLVLEGALRKWVFPGAQQYIYFAKDVMLVGGYLGFISARAWERYRVPQVPALYATLALAAAWGLLEIANPRLPNVWVGLFGFKSYFLYVPLLFVVPALFTSPGQLERFLRRYALVAIPVGLLAVAQFASPASSVLNAYAAAGTEGAQAITFGSSERVRVTGTFSFITGYSIYLIAVGFLLLGLLAHARWRVRWRSAPLLAALGLTVLGMLMTGSRAPVLMLVLLFPLYVMLSLRRERQTGRTFGRLILGLGLVCLVLGYVAPDAIHAFRGRAAGREDLPTRILLPFYSPVYAFEYAGLLGYGSGAAHQGSVSLVPNLAPGSWLGGRMFEDEPGRVMVELGPVGFTLIFLSRLMLVGMAFRQTKVLQHPLHRAIAVSCLLFLLSQVLGGVVFNATGGLLFWFFGGLLFTVMRLDRQVVDLARRQAFASAVPRAGMAPVRPASARDVGLRSQRGA